LLKSIIISSLILFGMCSSSVLAQESSTAKINFTQLEQNWMKAHPEIIIGINNNWAPMNYVDELLLHVSRPVRWDSDHVVIFDDELQAIMQEIIRGDYTEKIHIGLDFFDASINRIAAWVIGTRNTRKALLKALLEPTEMLMEVEAAGDYTSRLAYLEELKSYPFGAIWDYYCMQQDVPVREMWLENVKDYENEVLSARG
jgi:L-rhamnose isomerase